MSLGSQRLFVVVGSIMTDDVVTLRKTRYLRFLWREGDGQKRKLFGEVSQEVKFSFSLALLILRTADVDHDYLGNDVNSNWRCAKRLSGHVLDNLPS